MKYGSVVNVPQQENNDLWFGLLLGWRCSCCLKLILHFSAFKIAFHAVVVIHICCCLFLTLPHHAFPFLLPLLPVPTLPQYTLSAFMSYVRMHACMDAFITHGWLQPQIAHVRSNVQRFSLWVPLTLLKVMCSSYMQMAFHSPLLTNKSPLCIFTIFSSSFHLLIGF